jgi:hypothetical protein
MSGSIGNQIIDNSLLFCMDAANIKCYPQTGRTLSDLAKNDQGSLDFITPNSIQWSSNNYGYFDFPNNNAHIGFTGLLPQTIKPQPPITIEAWFQVYSGTTDFTSIVNIDGLTSGSSQYRGFNIGISPATSGLYYIGAAYGTAAGSGINNRKNLDSAQIYPINTWKHVVGVLNVGLSMNIYIDGLSVTGTTSGNASFLGYGTTGFLQLGKVGGGNPQYLSGRIAMAKVYNIAFTAEQALEAYNSTKYRFGL